MDIYRFFHPHHNPRLHNTPVRQQELFELEQVASELRKAIERVRERTRRRAPPPILPSHFDQVLKALCFVEDSIKTLCDAHPGDGVEELRSLIAERSEFLGWEHWCQIVRQQLHGLEEPRTENAGLQRQDDDSAVDEPIVVNGR